MSKAIKQSLLDDYTGVLTTSIGAVGSSSPWTVGTNSTYTMSNITLGDTYSISGAVTAGSVNQSGVMELRGADADIKVNGRSLMDAIDALEQRLNILVPNPELEKEWDELRELGNRYRALEKQCKEKGDMWNKLKSVPPGAK